jgi:hypothetical protein
MSEFFFELPVWFVIAGIVVGAGVAIYGNNRMQRGILLGGIGLILLTLVMTAVSYFVDTPREQSVKRTKAIIAAVNAQDWNALRGLLNPTTTIYGFTGPDEIATIGEALAGRFGLKSASVISTKGTGEGGFISVSTTVRHDFSSTMLPVTNWLFLYEERKDGILLSKIEAADRAGTPVAQIQGQFRK